MREQDIHKALISVILETIIIIPLKNSSLVKGITDMTHNNKFFCFVLFCFVLFLQQLFTAYIANDSLTTIIDEISCIKIM